MSNQADPSGTSPAASPNAGYLTTHVLDTIHGTPAEGMKLELYVRETSPDGCGDGRWLSLRSVVTDADGRLDRPLLSGDDFKTGCYRLIFDVEGYFRAKGLSLPKPAFLGKVSLDFGIADAQAHYHVPLLVSPWSYSTYRGS
ncbi:hydroxyisourate hydrolase [Aquabacterium sp.]|uniref:hydroxyisourate hydrolase n=1 Tax=Aquabacterium sp. TaxID=1872578 RepID=UPI0040380891